MNPRKTSRETEQARASDGLTRITVEIGYETLGKLSDSLTVKATDTFPDPAGSGGGRDGLVAITLCSAFRSFHRGHTFSTLDLLAQTIEETCQCFDFAELENLTEHYSDLWDAAACVIEHSGGREYRSVPAAARLAQEAAFEHGFDSEQCQELVRRLFAIIYEKQTECEFEKNLPPHTSP